MEIKQFQDSRNAKLADFDKAYNFLKTEYSSTLLSAIQEPDPAAQQQLISRVLQLNTELSSQVRSILSDINQGAGSFNPKTLDELTNDLIEYQKQYQEIQNNKDKLQTIKIIYSTNKKKLVETEFMYTIYLTALILLTFLVIYFVMRTSSISDTVDSIVTQVGGLRWR
jgi:DNA repair exonuclease SbcCD ATPase subunit